MWILKGALLGLLLILSETIAYIGFRVYSAYRNVPPHTGQVAWDLRGVFGPLTIQNPWWWAAIIGTFVIACWYFKARNA